MNSGKYTFRRSNIYDSPDFKLIIALREFPGKFYFRNFTKLLGRFKWVVFLDTDQRVGVPANINLLKVNGNTKRTTFTKFFCYFYCWLYCSFKLWEFEIQHKFSNQIQHIKNVMVAISHKNERNPDSITKLSWVVNITRFIAIFIYRMINTCVFPSTL